MSNETDTLPRVKVTLGSVKDKPIRFSYLAVHIPRENKISNNMEFSVAVLIPKDNVEDIKALKDGIEQLKREMWTDNKKPIPPKARWPLADGDTDVKDSGKPYGAECKGHYVINCKTSEDKPPNVVGTTRGEDGKFVKLAKRDIKSGDWGRISLSLAVYMKGSGGIGAYMSSVQLTKQGESLGAQTSAEEDFAEFDDEADAMLD